MNFVNPKNDIAFKKIFGNEQKTEILISFLNAVLDLTGNKEIQEITILNPYQAPRLEHLKETTLDVQAKDKRGITFIVEMQVKQLAGSKKRFVYYASKGYSSQIKRGEDYPKLNQVFFIGILDYKEFEGDSYLSRHHILNIETHKQELKDLEFSFIELPKFTKTEAELETILEKWVYFIKHAADLEMVPENADTEPLQAAYEMANHFSWSQEELNIYDYWSMRTQDDRGAIEFAKQQAEEEGMKKGMKKGEKKQAFASAKKMIADGLEADSIAKYTGLSLEEVLALISP